jgi:hypothetical protein
MLMGYKTLDGFELQEGEECWVSYYCGTGEHNISRNPRKARYMDDFAKLNKWDFTSVKPFRVDCDDTLVDAVWKNNPNHPSPKEWD